MESVGRLRPQPRGGCWEPAGTREDRAALVPQAPSRSWLLASPRAAAPSVLQIYSWGCSELTRSTPSRRRRWLKTDENVFWAPLSHKPPETLATGRGQRCRVKGEAGGGRLPQPSSSSARRGRCLSHSPGGSGTRRCGRASRTPAHRVVLSAVTPVTEQRSHVAAARQWSW